MKVTPFMVELRSQVCIFPIQVIFLANIFIYLYMIKLSNFLVFFSSIDLFFFFFFVLFLSIVGYGGLYYVPESLNYLKHWL